MEEIKGLVATLRSHGESFDVGVEVVDTCGTGGDLSGTINVSTLSALVVAGAGAVVCKHGGRGGVLACRIRGRAGSFRGGHRPGTTRGATVHRPSGHRVLLRPALSSDDALCRAGRRELGVTTTFNFVGPLVNPAGAKRSWWASLILRWPTRCFEVLETFGAVHAMVVFGHDGLDELSTTATSTLIESVRESDGTYRRRSLQIDPASLGLRRATREDLAGGDAATNAQLGLRLLDGENGPRRDLVCLNAAAALVVAGLADDLGDGFEIAGAAIDDGNARSALDRLVKVSKAAAEAIPAAG